MTARRGTRRGSPDEHARLARAFGIVPTRLKVPVVTSGSLALVALLSSGVMLIPAAGILLGIGGLSIGDRRRVTRQLREVASWGFPVEGYRAWLLASEPAFDLELQQPIGIDVIEESANAIDATIVVERRGERLVRIVTRPIDLPASRFQPAMNVGDRRLLFELRDRILAPVHADVGIVAMRMGERSTMTALVATPAQPPSGHDQVGGAFREQASAAPPALQALVRVGTSRLRPPSDARSSSARLDRIMYATGRIPTGVGSVVALMLGGTIGGASFGGVGAVLGLAGGLVAGLYTTLGRNQAHLRSVLDSPTRHGFVVEGYEDWLISGRPIFDLELRAPTDRAALENRMQIRAYSVSTGTEVPWVEGFTWLSDTLVRVETRPMLVEPAGTEIPPFFGGSRVLFEQLVHNVLISLHAQVGIVAIRMGGHVDRRADPTAPRLTDGS